MQSSEDYMDGPFYALSQVPGIARGQFMEAFKRRDREFVSRYFSTYGKDELKSSSIVRRECAASISSLEFAVQIGFDVSIKDSYDNWNVLHWAAYDGNLNVVQYLWEKYPELRTSLTGQTGWFFRNGHENALICGVRGNQPEVCRFILEQKILDVNAKAAQSETALHWAVFNPYFECALLLILHGADHKLKNSLELNPFEKYKKYRTSNIQGDGVVQELERFANMQGSQKQNAIEAELAKIPHPSSSSSSCTIF